MKSNSIDFIYLQEDLQKIWRLSILILLELRFWSHSFSYKVFSYKVLYRYGQQRILTYARIMLSTFELSIEQRALSKIVANLPATGMGFHKEFWRNHQEWINPRDILLPWRHESFL